VTAAVDVTDISIRRVAKRGGVEMAIVMLNESANAHSVILSLLEIGRSRGRKVTLVIVPRPAEC